jgi:YgiT-type zinc finger domain-containing protein
MKKRAKKPTKEVCPVCGGELRDELVTHTEQAEHGLFYIYEHVPAQVCVKCGEHLFSDAILEKMDALAVKAKPHRKVEAPVYDLAQA